jgi:hypothetical protein
MSALPVDNPAPPPKRTDPRGFRPLGWLRLARNVARAWLGHVLTVRPALARGTLVLGDRWVYGYLIQPLALRFFGPASFARIAVLLLPRPDLVANLTAPVGLIRNRKQELSGPQIAAELAAWALLPVPELKTFEANAAPEVIASRILQEL